MLFAGGRKFLEGTASPATASLSSILRAPTLDVEAPTLDSIIFSDTFTSGNKSYQHPTTGARWWGSGTSSTVIADPGNSSGFALRQRFGTWAEQRFYLGPAATAGAYKELWIKKRIWFPANYATPGNVVGAEGVNNKFFRLWHGDIADAHDGYGDYIVKGGFSLIANNSISGIRRELGSNVDGVGPQGTSDVNGFITAADLGAEMTVVMHMKLDTIGTPGLSHGPPSTGNGRLAIWKNGVLFAEKTDAHWRSQDGTGEFFEYGYPFGYANSHFAETTDILIRELTMATTNVFGVS